MIGWKRVPWPLWVFAVAQLLIAARVEIKVHGPVLLMVLYPGLIIGWLYLLLRGMRWVWLTTLALFVLGLVFELVSGSLRWWGIAMALVEITLLLLPVTRSYFTHGWTPVVT
ncbi:MAG TPA: hypothetical protein VFN85_12555 [Solirubrobacterales bacterium]|nr:hypothetical protein [Solirubrobacterales bacterium]